MTVYGRHDDALAYNGISLRDYLAAHAPIDFTIATEVWGGSHDLGNDDGRAAFMSVWSLLRYEYADAMMSHRASAAPQQE